LLNGNYNKCERDVQFLSFCVVKGKERKRKWSCKDQRNGVMRMKLLPQAFERISAAGSTK
jgi:hypothetical protein